MKVKKVRLSIYNFRIEQKSSQRVLAPPPLAVLFPVHYSYINIYQMLYHVYQTDKTRVKMLMRIAFSCRIRYGRPVLYNHCLRFDFLSFQLRE